MPSTHLSDTRLQLFTAVWFSAFQFLFRLPPKDGLSPAKKELVRTRSSLGLSASLCVTASAGHGFVATSHSPPVFLWPLISIPPSALGWHK